MSHLTSFQQKCRDNLLKLSRKQGKNIKEFIIKKTMPKWFTDKEIFLETSIGDSNIWIYEDGAYIKTKNKNIPFEFPDYDTEDDLIHAFINTLISLEYKGDSVKG